MSRLLPNSQSASESPSSTTHHAGEFSAEERSTLLRTAHDAIEAGADGRQLVPGNPGSHLAEPRGVFTTIYLHGHLRGCVGYVSAVAPLYLAVAETARAAAFEDTRFPAITREEARGLQVSLSILSPAREMDPAQVEIGRHGLLISLHGRRGLLLPQVATEHGWDRVTFLQETCYKAGLPPDAWQHGARVEAFTAEVFSDSDLAE